MVSPGVFDCIISLENLHCLIISTGTQAKTVVIRTGTFENIPAGEPVHAKVKWDGSRTQNWLRIEEGPNQYTAAHSGHFAVVLTVRTRNIIVTGWSAKYNFDVQASTGLVFHDVNLSEEDWVTEEPNACVRIRILDIATDV